MNAEISKWKLHQIVSTSKRRMSNETCMPLKLEKKLLLARDKVVRARKFDLFIPRQPKAERKNLA